MTNTLRITFATLALGLAQPALAQQPLSKAEKEAVRAFNDLCPQRYDLKSVEAAQSGCLRAMHTQVLKIAVKFREDTNDAGLLLRHFPALGYARQTAHVSCGRTLDGARAAISEGIITPSLILTFTKGVGDCLEAINGGLATGAPIYIDGTIMSAVYAESKCLNISASGNTVGIRECNAYKAQLAARLK